ncbi:HAD family phosphatase [Proteiniclasticum sp. SCR006]|uniref:HAD family phosphatase n=1 Tax=Proteiniclasticum aestuarii TaxID=2817862 RepID=A0A939H9C9_9CLOT|nr:Cof-type HAD-IIB family hydrolase [Proteiniclasticum aestuarii]MBO1264934.1 HAD family phosphatase [Proteiniclasticum aestuarii]
MKLFVTDLDGTLLNSEHKLSEFSMNAIKTAMDKGIPVCIATGRSYNDILEIISELDVKPYIISSNGASVYNTDGEKMYSISIPKDQVREIITYLKAQNLEFEVADDEYTYITQKGLDILHQELEDVGSVDTKKREELEQDVLGLVLSQGNLKVVPDMEVLLDSIESANSVSSISAYLNKIHKAMERFTMDKRILTFSSWKYNFEMTSSDTSKGIALKHLCEHLGIGLSDVAVIGDNYNDLSMIKIAGIKGAMGNAVENIKSMADFQAPTNDEDGAAKFLYKLMEDMGL